MVVVISLGSSAEPMGGGSTYLSVVMSERAQVNASTRSPCDTCGAYLSSR